MPEIEEMLEEIIKRMSALEEIVFAPQVEGTTAKPSPEDEKQASLTKEQRTELIKALVQKHGLKAYLDMKKRVEEGQEIERLLDKPFTDLTMPELARVEQYRGKVLARSTTKRVKEFTEGMDLAKDISYNELTRIRIDHDPYFSDLFKKYNIRPGSAVHPQGDERPIINIDKMARESDGNTMILEEIRARQRAERKRLGLEN